MMKKNLVSYGVNFLSILIIYLLFITLMQTGVITSYYQGILITVCINIILATSLNLSTGCLGELVLGHAGFMSVGAYTAALFTKAVPLPAGLEFPVGILLAGLCAAFFGLLIGIPALRLRGDYLAIITLGFGEIIRVILLNLDFTGGGRGLSGIEEYTNFHWVFVIMVLTVAILFSLFRSRQGRAILSVRENQVAADSVGINTTKYKIMAFVISSFFAGIAGALYAHYITIIDPSYFGFNLSIEILVMVVLGGMGSFTGSILAASLLTLLPEVLRGFNDYRLLIYSILLVAMMIFKPEGLLGKYEFSLTRFLSRCKRFFFKGRKTVDGGAE